VMFTLWRAALVTPRWRVKSLNISWQLIIVQKCIKCKLYPSWFKRSWDNRIAYTHVLVYNTEGQGLCTVVHAGCFCNPHHHLIRDVFCLHNNKNNALYGYVWVSLWG
jgi:hypothetical protein